MHTYIFRHAPTHMHTHIHTYVQTFIQTYRHTHTYIAVYVRTCIGMAAYTHASCRSHLRTISLVPCSCRDAAPSRVGAHGRAVSTQSTQRDCRNVHSEGVPPCEYSRVLRGCRVQVRCGDGGPRGAQRGPHGGERAARRGAGGARGGECAARRAVRPL